MTKSRNPPALQAGPPGDPDDKKAADAAPGNLEGASVAASFEEVRPDFVKVDRSIVAGLDADPARQALIVGLNHFVRAINCRVIAEGIETEAERATLQALDIHLGQGYLLGRPLPAG